MEAFYNWLNSLVNKNKSEFAQWSRINWLNSYSAYEFQEQRDRLLQKIDSSFLFKETKPYYNHISRGCSICGSGKWSCLFITNKCNAACFYCPTSQQNDEKPSTQALEFKSADDYANYIKFFQFDGVSFSGGEPLLVFDRTLEYLHAVRSICRDDIYIWMYTNGILANRQQLQQLANVNLNEIRFDIGATGFTLDKVRLAKGIIPNITIEIPAIPEEKERLIALLPEMVDAGVTNLNLHHLRLTQYNISKLIKHGYTIINAEKPLVLESELAALEIINKAKELELPIGVNYCSFHFKNRFQKAGYRKIIMRKLFPDAIITKNGYLREYTGSSLIYKSLKLINKDVDLFNSLTINVEGETYYYFIYQVFKEDNLSIEKQQTIEILLNNEPEVPPGDSLLFKIWQLEYIENGLRFY